MRTPHETADANTVDRFHPWLGVGSRRHRPRDVLRHAAERGAHQRRHLLQQVDRRRQHLVGAGAGDQRTSPHIEDSFQWGDYNGLDVLGGQVLGIFTDNRNESRGSADSVDVYAASPPAGGPVCGNNLREVPEVCDGSDLAGQTCVSQGFTGGTLVQRRLLCVRHRRLHEHLHAAGRADGRPLTATSTRTTWRGPLRRAPRLQRPALDHQGRPVHLRRHPRRDPFPDTGLTCNTTYYYVVQGDQRATCASGNSAQASATTNTCPVGGNQVLTFSAAPALAIPDNNATGITSTINVAQLRRSPA